MRKRLAWWCRVKGDEPLLKKTAKVFPQQLECEGGDWYIAMPEFDASADELQVLNAAEQRIRLMTAIINVFTNTPGEAWIENTLYTYPDGKQKGFATSLRWSVRVSSDRCLEALSRSDGEVTIGTKLFASLKSNAPLFESLRKIGGDPLSWGDLYLLYEHAQNAAGGDSGLGLMTGASKARLSRFARSANMHRHPSGEFTPPNRPMTHSEARAFVVGLLWSLLTGQKAPN